MIKNFTHVAQIVLFTFFVLQIQNITAQLKHQNKLTTGIEKYELIIKFKEGSIKQVQSENLVFEETFLKANSTITKQFDSFKFEQIISSVKNSKKFSNEKRAFDVNDFKELVLVKGASLLPKSKVLSLANKFEKYSFVEYATIRPVKAPPSPRVVSHVNKVTYSHTSSVLATPDLTDRQGYLKGFIGDDVYGIDADYAQSIGIFGQGIKVADVEWGMDYLHEDLKSNNFVELIKAGVDTDKSHGTSVSGILIGKNNGFGITGAVYKLDKFYGVSHYSTDLVYRPEHALLTALSKLDVGDVLILEMQSHEYEPIDIYQSIWDIIKAATDSGIIVVEAAGNGSLNLESSVYQNFRDRGDNGVIRVGAGTRKGRNKLAFSNYGNSVHIQAWGEKVVTTGIEGNLIYNGGDQAAYIDDFAGTSSATAIVATSIVSLQSYAKNEFGVILKPKEVKDLLISTGTPQGAGGHIGPLPNIKRMFKKIEEIHGKIPNFSLPSGEWRLITLPADPGSNNTIQDILGDDIPGEIGVDWAIYSYNGLTNKYTAHKIEDKLKPGVAYWVIHESGTTVTLDMPGSSTRLSNQFKVQLNTRNNKTTWNMVGFPFTSEARLSKIKVHTTSEPCNNGCSINSQEIVDGNFLLYKDGGYRKVIKVTPWEGFFTKTTKKSHGNNPYLKYKALREVVSSPSNIKAEYSSEKPYSPPVKAFEINRMLKSARIYPNPSNGISNLTITSSYRGELNIKIYSMEGKLMKDMKLEKTDEILMHQLSLSNYSSGIYAVSIIVGEHYSNHQIIKI